MEPYSPSAVAKGVLEIMTKRNPILAKSVKFILETDDIPRDELTSRVNLDSTVISRRSYDILLQYPVARRHRRDRALTTLDEWLAKASRDNFIHVNVVVDRGDELHDVDTFKLFTQVANKYASFVSMTITSNLNPGKVQAYNAGINAMLHKGVWLDAIVIASDDLHPQVQCWDAIITRKFALDLMTWDAVLHFNDGYTGRRICTYPIIGIPYFKRFGYVYHPSYKSLFCDNEFTEVARLLADHGVTKYEYSDMPLVAHFHPANKKSAPIDGLYLYNDAFWAQDKHNYNKRSAEGFDLCGKLPGLDGSPDDRPLLSVCICTLHERAASFAKLRMKLEAQIAALRAERDVELLFEIDGRESPTGTKRNKLLERARGRYIVFFDDDDDVSDTILGSMLWAARQSNGYDCISISGRLIDKGRPLGFFDMSISHGCYHQTGTYYYRTPNHVCAIRAEIAKMAKFPDIYRGEDTEYARRILPYLRTEYKIPGYSYIYSPSDTSMRGE